MKTLLVIGIILASLATYFVFNTEKSISIKSMSDVIPAGIDVAKLLLNKAVEQIKKINPDIINSASGTNSGGVLQSKLAEDIKSKISDISSKVINLVKKPIEDKAIELFCPQK